MRSRRLAIGAAGFALLAATVATAATPNEASRKAALAVVSETPVKVRGLGFRPYERVTLRASVANESFVKRLRAGRTGRFTALFTSARITECTPFSLSAVGAAGSRATLVRKFDIPPPCGVAPQD